MHKQTAQCTKRTPIWIAAIAGLAAAVAPLAGAERSDRPSEAGLRAQSGVQEWFLELLHTLEMVLTLEGSDGFGLHALDMASNDARSVAEAFVERYRAGGIQDNLSLLLRLASIADLKSARSLVSLNPEDFTDPWWQATFIPTLDAMEADLVQRP